MRMSAARLLAATSSCVDRPLLYISSSVKRTTNAVPVQQKMSNFVREGEPSANIRI